ncbi:MULTISPECIES: sodium:solute symporter [unclassified Haloferax]|uniref:sodium:solute symporter family protein n=1 Tax=Haloferax TaxID=2251 RepID=UPI0002B14F22|nr:MULTISPECIES: sodium:solute symporter family protein [unclassified Haloferax]ELZ60663.1 sodium:pantothenate symporter [Haloferax sp. ATCC BAA-645]ELZ61818.1 sodium:pantothenate symporter [Haloferax sp. ATCC BAA-646]ELZ71574.1 sodium:pantothenate symporter [Haloferax sp. ATCC BAA-644]
MTPTETYLWIGLVLFLGVVGVLGYLGWKQTETMSDFAIANAELGPYVLGSAFAATFFSAATFVGYVGWSYNYGLSNLWLFLTLIGASPIALILFAKRVREINVTQRSLSLPDWVGEFYGSQFVRVGAAVAVMFNLFYIAAQLDAGALFFTTLLGFSQEVGLFIITALVVLYVIAGATYADVYTDAVQGVLMAIMGVVVFVSVFWTIGGGPIGAFMSVQNSLQSISPDLVQPLNAESALYYSGFAIFSVFVLEFAFSAQPQLFNKVLAISDPSELRKMIVTYVLMTLAFILVIFGGFYLLALEPGIGSADQAVFLYAQNYFPAVVGAFLGIVILAAALSTTDGIFIVLSTAVANDIFLKFLVAEGYVEMDDDRADRVSKYIAQGVVIVSGVIAYYIALTAPFNIGELIWVGIAGVASATVPPVMVGIYFPEFVTRKAAMSSLVVGVLGYLVITVVSNSPSVFVRGTYALLLSTAVMVGVSAVTTQEDGVAEITESSAATGGD